MKIPFFSQRQNRAAMSIPAAKRSSSDPADIILQYHEQTKHHYYRFARSLGFLDWENQPNPFRRFQGTPLFQLPLLPMTQSASLKDLFSQSNLSPAEFSIQSISIFLRNALAISAWKRAEDERWSLRVNPSSGNLHPTEGYVIVPEKFSDLPAGVYHYASKEHALEQRAKLNQDAVQNFPADTFFVGLSSIHWREAWKYGERAYRYCQHDAGHAIAALRISAALLGWNLIVVDELNDDDTARVLGLNRPLDFEQAEDEDPICISAVFKSGEGELSKELIDSIEHSEWKGQANLLSESHVEWEIVDQAAKASYKPTTASIFLSNDRVNHPIVSNRYHSVNAEQIIQQRRSCLALDGVTSITRDVFYSILSSVSSNDSLPFDSFQRSEMNKPRIHLALFVLRIDDFEPGIYFLLRNPDSLTDLKEAMNSNFKWQRPEDCPDQINLFLLRSGDFRKIAEGVACGQDVGGDGVFSLGMIAELEDPIRNIGPWMYKRLFWEAGAIGQILYLQAEAAGLRSTGIGCYYDDPMHELLGLKGQRFQDLYHFTMGGNVDDLRLTTEPPYPESSV